MPWLATLASSVGSGLGAAGSALGSAAGSTGSALGAGLGALGKGAASAAQAIPSVAGDIAQSGGGRGYLANLMTNYANQGLLPMDQPGPPAPQTGLQQAAGVAGGLMQNPGLELMSLMSSMGGQQPPSQSRVIGGPDTGMSQGQGTHKLRI